jgi:hypothetical protein
MTTWTRRVEGWMSSLALACLFACGDDASEVATTSAATTTAHAGVDTTTGDAADDTTVASTAGPHQDLSDALGFALQQSLDGSIVPAPDPACFERAVDQADPEARQAAVELVADPFAWFRLADEIAFPLASAYVGCADIVGVRSLLAIGTINDLDAAECIADAWSDELTADIIVASLSFGTGLDDLPPDVVTDLAGDAAACVPDETWWIDDIAFEIDGEYNLSAEQATCVATAFVRSFGIEHAIRRRVLTIPMLTLSDEELAVLDLGACGAEVTLPPLTLGAAVGECLADVDRGDREPALVPCDTTHNGEIFAVLDLADVVAEWPGVRFIGETAARVCKREAESVTAGQEGLGLEWSVPSRQVWERGGRLVTCVVGHVDGRDWTAPSGLVPQPSVSTTVDYYALVVGQCLIGDELVGGGFTEWTFEAVDCSVPHHAEVFHVSDLPDPAGTPYPGDRMAADLAQTLCVPGFQAYVGRPYMDSRLGFVYVNPYSASWADGDRRVMCYLHDREGALLSGSMAGTDQ